MAEADRETAALQFAFLEILTFLAASAHGLVHVSKLYGPMRLMEAAERLIGLMDTMKLADEELRELAEEIIANTMVIATDETHCLAFTDRATMQLASRLKAALPLVAEQAAEWSASRPTQTGSVPDGHKLV